MKFFYFLSLIVFVAACTPGGGGSLPSNEHAFSGTKGLEMEFIEDAPPSRLIVPGEDDPAEPLKFAVEVHNRGAVDIEDGILVLSFERNRFSIDKNSKPFDLEGRALFPEGGKDIIIYDGWLKHSSLSTEGADAVQLRLLGCYQYQTLESVAVCVGPQRISLSEVDPVCDSDTISTGTQGAPIVIRQVEPLMPPEGEGLSEIRPTFRIYIDNADRGTVIDHAGYQAGCTADEPGEDFFNTVHVKAWLSDTQLNCETPFSLDKREFVECASPDPFPAGDTNFVTQLRIELSYGYRSTLSKTVTLE